jgi:hypothetical protein
VEKRGVEKKVVGLLILEDVVCCEVAFSYVLGILFVTQRSQIVGICVIFFIVSCSRLSKVLVPLFQVNEGLPSLCLVQLI